MPLEEVNYGTSQSFAGTTGNANFTVTNSSNETLNTAGFRDSEFWIGDGDSFETHTHTHTFTQQVGGVRIDMRSLGDQEAIQIKLDGVLIDIEDAILNGTITLTNLGAAQLYADGGMITTAAPAAIINDNYFASPANFIEGAMS